ncbi:MAG: type III CRISPR-associated RAMP protein Csx7 [Candidatus Helarchaeota archaeon]
MDWLSNDVILRKISFEGVIDNETILHVGGRGSSVISLTDNELVRVNIRGEEMPYIPGSTIKGLLRSATASVLQALGIETCENDDYEGCLEANTLLNNIKWLEKDKVLNILDKFCPICKIFGAGKYRSKVIITDAYPSDPGELRISVKSQNAIDRRQGSAIRGGLFTLEYILPRNRFNFEIVFNNLPNYLVGLVALGMKLVNSGIIRVGMMKSKGFGHIKFKIKRLKIITDDGDGKKLARLNERDSEITFEKLELDKEENIEKFTDNILDKFIESWANYVKG